MDEELQRYRIEQSERWLKKVRNGVEYAERLEELAAARYAVADNLKGIDYSAVHVRTSPMPDAIANAVANHEDLGDVFQSIADDARARVDEAARALASLEDTVEATCLLLYYVDYGKGKPNGRQAEVEWEHVCVKMHYTYDGMMKLRRRALLSAYDVMPHSERDPMPPAI